MVELTFEEMEGAAGVANLEVKEWFLRGDYTILPDAILADKSLTPATKLVLMGVLSHIRKQGGGKCFPSEETLARETGLAKRTVRSAKYRLKARGWLDWSYIEGSMPRRCTYTLKVPIDLDGSDPNDAEGESQELASISTYNK